LRFVWPFAGPVISSFGPDEQGARNDGINIAAERGVPFRAAAQGTVGYAGALRGYGNLILITHPNGYVTAYAHAENIAVARGDEVGRGQVIGTAGNTGGVDRPQLHFEIRRGITPIDPRLLLAASS
jgi:murein DD-endopeptidase MepM/ murein hydrolase activator NlpD